MDCAITRSQLVGSDQALTNRRIAEKGLVIHVSHDGDRHRRPASYDRELSTGLAPSTVRVDVEDAANCRRQGPHSAHLTRRNAKHFGNTFAAPVKRAADILAECKNSIPLPPPGCWPARRWSCS
jgi:hypothetical protein